MSPRGSGRRPENWDFPGRKADDPSLSLPKPAHPSRLRGLRLSKLSGRDGVIVFESNGLFVGARGKGFPQTYHPGFRDIRGYRAMYRDFLSAVRDRRAPEMSLERAIEDQLLMDRIYASL